MTSQCKVAVVATHPIHYQIQLYKRLALDPEIDVTMLFCSRFGLTRQIDHTFGGEVQWYDESILNGCQHKFLSDSDRVPSSMFGISSLSVAREIRRGRYDLLLVQGYSGLTEWLAMFAAKRKFCRVLFRGETTLSRPSSRVRAGARDVLMRALTRSVDVFLPIGKRSEEFYLRYGVPAHRLVLSPYAVDNEFFFSQARLLHRERQRIRKSLGIPAKVPVILYASKMIPRKRPMDLLKAFERLDLPAVLLFVGDGPLRSEVERYVDQKNLTSVICVGFQNQDTLPRFYAIADVFVNPSAFEPWGLVVNEAMCFSLPIVTTFGVSSAIDLVTDGKNGFLYEPGDVGALHDGLRELIRNSQRRIDMGRRSRKFIRRWNLDASVEGIRRAIHLPAT